jgi:hypothetical protein
VNSAADKTGRRSAILIFLVIESDNNCQVSQFNGDFLLAHARLIPAAVAPEL